MTSPRILLADADAFFVGVARMVDPEGAGKTPLLIVGGTRESRGVVCSASYETRRFGVRSAMSIAQALRLCPDAMCVPVPGKACGVKSREIRQALARFSPVVEGASIDEWYMDLSGTEGVYHHEPIADTAHRMREAVRRETGLSISIGGGTNKLIAKLAVERAKPKPDSGANGVHIVEPGNEEGFLRTFTLAEIPLVGPKFQERLAALGMRTVPDVLQYDPTTLRRWLGKREAEWLWDRVHGVSNSVVESGGEAKSISRDETFPEDLREDHELERELLKMVTRAAFDMRGDGLAARTITVRLRDMDFRTRSARRTLVKPVVADRVILGVARELLVKLRKARRVPARLLGVALSSLTQDPKADQLTLFAVDTDPLAETDRDRALARTVDRVREKFGAKGILPAALTCLLALMIPGSTSSAQQKALTAADSALVGRILVAEDRRDSTDSALTEAAGHADARVRRLAQRALGRIRDPRFSARDSLPPLSAPLTWPEPGWRLRYRALSAQREDCGALRAAVADLDWRIRLRAADLATASCAPDEALVATLRGWADSLPAITDRRERNGVSWHAGAHAVVALARLRPAEARPRVARLMSHRQWQVRMYSARAAAELADTVALRALARDRDDNVKEAAIEALAKLTGRADDDIYLAALDATGAQAVRAAALALKGSSRADVRAKANVAFERWVNRSNESERDARVALLEAAGRPASDDSIVRRVKVEGLIWSMPREFPPRAVALALGADVRLRVSMAQSSGGGSFVVRLRGDVAPMMAAQILDRVMESYYDSLSWHRVEHDFVIQGGSRGSNEYVGYEAYLRDELGTVPHVRGTVGMSTRGHDTGDAQWFVNLKDNLRLGRDYTVFAEVIEGMGIVDGILEGDVIATIREIGETRRIRQVR